MHNTDTPIQSHTVEHGVREQEGDQPGDGQREGRGGDGRDGPSSTVQLITLTGVTPSRP